MKVHFPTYKKDPRQYDFGVRGSSVMIHRVSKWKGNRRQKWEEDRCAEMMAKIEGFFPCFSDLCVFPAK